MPLEYIQKAIQHLQQSNLYSRQCNHSSVEQCVYDHVNMEKEQNFVFSKQTFVATGSTIFAKMLLKDLLEKGSARISHYSEIQRKIEKILT